MGNERTWIKRILFVTDFSHCARHAEEHAAFLSKAYGATVDVAHVLELYPGVYAAVQDHGETDGRVDEAARRLQLPTVQVTGHQLIGTTSVQICEAAMKYRADLIVLGTHGRTDSTMCSWGVPRNESSPWPHARC